MGFSIIAVLIVSSSGRIIWQPLLRSSDADTLTLEKWDLCGFSLNGYSNVCSFFDKF